MILLEIDWRVRMSGERQFKVALTMRASLGEGKYKSFYRMSWVWCRTKSPLETHQGVDQAGLMLQPQGKQF